MGVTEESLSCEWTWHSHHCRFLTDRRNGVEPENDHAWQVDIDFIKANGYNLDIKNPHRAEEEKQHSSTELLDLLHQSFAKGDQLLEQLRKELV